LKTFPCAGREDLYNAVSKFPWDKHFSAANSFTIKSDLVLSELTNTSFVSQVTKDAIVDYFRDKTGQRPAIDNEHPELRLHLFIEKNEAVLSLTLSGTSLHQRAYRVKNVKATLKENIAAVLLLRAHWPKWAKLKETFVDPLCGSGTFAIEAALLAADMAPGLFHPFFGSPAWLGHDPAVWQNLLNEAEARKQAGLKHMPAIYALDKDPAAITAATANVKHAGLSDYIQIIQADIHELAHQPIVKTPHGLVALNPPYGKRLSAGGDGGTEAGYGNRHGGDGDGGTNTDLKRFYQELGQILYTNFSGWDVVMLTASEELTKSTGLRAHKINSLFNGPIKCIAAYFYLTEERLYKSKKQQQIAQQAASHSSGVEPLSDTPPAVYAPIQSTSAQSQSHKHISRSRR
jgi:23S rRNA (guanine2445-N2)-methyltransferase / 23S rRNA (guanine2069-N7)-methyltransferase